MKSEAAEHSKIAPKDPIIPARLNAKGTESKPPPTIVDIKENVVDLIPFRLSSASCCSAERAVVHNTRKKSPKPRKQRTQQATTNVLTDGNRCSNDFFLNPSGILKISADSFGLNLWHKNSQRSQSKVAVSRLLSTTQ